MTHLLRMLLPAEHWKYAAVISKQNTGKVPRGEQQDLQARLDSCVPGLTFQCRWQQQAQGMLWLATLQFDRVIIAVSNSLSPNSMDLA